MFFPQGEGSAFEKAFAPASANAVPCRMSAEGMYFLRKMQTGDGTAMQPLQSEFVPGEVHQTVSPCPPVKV